MLGRRNIPVGLHNFAGYHYSAPAGNTAVADYCEERICVCVFVRVSVCEHRNYAYNPIANNFVHATYDRG